MLGCCSRCNEQNQEQKTQGPGAHARRHGAILKHSLPSSFDHRAPERLSSAAGRHACTFCLASPS
jgi:hypothetical protein